VTRVEAQPGPERPYLTALLADLPEDPSLCEWAPTRQVVLVERTDPLCDRSIETPDLGDLS
jgi:hypothetical protein